MEITWEEYIFTAGLHIDLTAKVSKNINYYLIGLEMGYRNINSTNNFYISIKADFIIAIAAMLVLYGQ